MTRKDFYVQKTLIRLLPVIIFMSIHVASAQKITVDRNKPGRREWFSSLGFGMFIHWAPDVQLGAIISHNVAASSQDYQDWYFNEMPDFFDPKQFDPQEWARLAALAGMKYVVFTAKHHSGFCMWDTETVQFKVTNTPCGKDVLAEILEAFRNEGIATGLYFSPDDFYLSYKQGLPPSRNYPATECPNNEEIWETDKKQLRELLTRYGKIDILFLDEKNDWVNSMVADYCWDIDPDLMITRGGMETPEQHLPNQPLPGPWEACYTIGSHWQYVGGEPYKDATELIYLLIETRAKGGNLLLNVGPDSHGRIPLRQESRLREIALWYRANHEAVDNTVPFDVVSESLSSTGWGSNNRNTFWFTAAKDKNCVYVFVPGHDWPHMSYKNIFIRSLLGNEKTRVSVLGQTRKMMEYRIDISPEPVFAITGRGIFIHAVRAQRLNKTWDNPGVIRITHVKYNRP